MPSLSPLSEGSLGHTSLSEGTETLVSLSEGTETLATLAEVIYTTRYLWPGEFYPAYSLTAGSLYPGGYGDETGLTLVITSDATETLTPLTEA